MKTLVPILLICFLTACEESTYPVYSTSYIVETVVQLQPNSTTEVLELFKSTNHKLVSNEPDWIRASFSTIEEKGVVIVRAQWKDKKSYLKFSNSDKFKKTMKQFNKYFIAKPEVSISKVLYEM